MATIDELSSTEDAVSTAIHDYLEIRGVTDSYPRYVAEDLIFDILDNTAAGDPKRVAILNDDEIVYQP